MNIIVESSGTNTTYFRSFIGRFLCDWLIVTPEPLQIHSCLYLDPASRSLQPGQNNWKFDHQKSDSKGHRPLQRWDRQQDSWRDRALGYQWVQQVWLSFNLSPVNANLLVFLSEPVPKPTVFLECNKEKTLCDLTCKANITSHFGPVRYRWEAGKNVLSRKMKLSLTKVCFKVQLNLWVQTTGMNPWCSICFLGEQGALLRLPFAKPL